MPGFYDVDAVSKIAVNLFYGWGYNFYRKENQLRADDQLIRAKVGFLLSSARNSVEIAETDYRREFLPPLTREKSQHDPAAVANAQAIERLSKAISGLILLINTQPVPENDRMSQRYREEAPTLQAMIQSDQVLVGQAELLRTTVEAKNGAWLAGNKAEIEDGLKAIGETLRKRQGLLFPA
jgi:hypothetical protein